MLLELWAGDILLTKNNEEIGNESPGDLNHAAIYVGEGIVVESQQEPKQVIAVAAQSFIDRYPYIKVLRYTDKVVAERAAKNAYYMIGTPYDKASSIFRRMRNWRGVNCVALVRKAYRDATTQDPGWQFPDHIFEEVKHGHFKVVWSKDDCATWQKPEKWFEYYPGLQPKGV
jgi:uncharacterized protein YycO